MKTLKLWILLILAGSFTNAFSQGTNEETQDMRLIGFGLHVEQFKLNDLFSDFMPTTRIMVSITPINYFRVELEYGGLRYTEEEKEYNYKQESSANTISFGLLGMMQYGKTNLYGGFRYMNSSSKSEWTYQDPIDNDEENTSRSGFAPVIGAEYFFSPRFSFGGEIGYMIYSDEYEYKWLNQTEKSTTKGSNTFSGLLVRFYL